MRNDDAALFHATKYRSNAAGAVFRNKSELHVCIACGCTKIERVDRTFGVTRVCTRMLGANRVCTRCKAEWYVNHCWSCKNHYVDSRDAATPKCKACGWHKCSHCGACKQSGCSTNPYSQCHRFCDENHSAFLNADRFGEDWCDSIASGLGRRMVAGATVINTTRAVSGALASNEVRKKIAKRRISR
jgi:hypothetical protein